MARPKIKLTGILTIVTLSLFNQLANAQEYRMFYMDSISNNETINYCPGFDSLQFISKAEANYSFWFHSNDYGDTIRTDILNLPYGYDGQVTYCSYDDPVSMAGSEYLTVTVHPFIVEAGNGKRIVCGNPVQLNDASINYSGPKNLTYSWSPVDGLSDPTALNPTVETTTSQTYTLTISAENGCVGNDTVTVTVVPLNVKTGEDLSAICGDNIQFNKPVTNYNGPGTVSYSWLPAEGLDNPSVQQPTAEITSDKTYVLTVTNESGCVAKDSIKVKMVPLTVNTGDDQSVICGGNIQFNQPVTNYNGPGTLSYSWTPAEGLDDASAPQPTVEITSDQTYVLTLSNESGCIAHDTLNVRVNPLELTANDVDISCGNVAQMNVSSNYTGDGQLTYNWTPAENLNATDISDPVASVTGPADYSVEVSTPNGCKASKDVHINLHTIDIQPTICMVTVGEGEKNVVVWGKPVSNSIDSFLIYRESTYQTNQYDLIGKVSYTAEPYFVDSSSNALIQSNRYKIACKDACGFTTPKSPEHKTMHLNINKGQDNSWNLIWEEYGGFTVSSYRIYRGSTMENLALIGSTTSGNTSFTDFSAPAGDVFYQIEVIPPYSCNSRKSTNFNSSRSNIASVKTSSIAGQDSNGEKITVYPVPVKDELHLSVPLTMHQPVVTIFSTEGRIMGNFNLNNGENRIAVSSLTRGMYIIRVTDAKRSFVTKFFKD